jgi:hypothetical protein
MEWDFWGSTGQDGLVAMVDPSDLRRVWIICHSQKAQTPNRQVAIGFGAFERVCSSGSDVRATWYRAALLEMLCGSIGLLPPWLNINNGELHDAVFRVAAKFPIKKLQVGTPNQGPPLDVQTFLKQIEEQTIT